MIEVSPSLITDFFQQEFPDQPYDIGKNYWFVQAGNCLGRNLHYEYNANKVHLHIEGNNWRPIRDFLRNHIMDSRVSKHHWARKACCWTLNTEPQNWEEIKEAFRTLAYIMNPYISKFERLYSIPQSTKEETQPIAADFIKIEDCLSRNLQIPNYQRPYRWKIKNVELLLNDIKENQSNGKLTYLIGTIILQRKKENIFDIVDGQQRITTLILLLKQLGYEGPYPILKYNHTDSFANIKANYKYIGQWLKMHITDQTAFYQYIMTSCQFVEITVQELNEAFQMFESQNGRGKELEAYNLLKAFHIRAMSNVPLESKVACDQQWEDAAMYLDSKGNRKDLLRQLFKEQLYRPRLWSRGQDAYRFNKKTVDEFKGVTIDNEHFVDFAYQNRLVQQEIANMMMRTINTGLFKIKSRFIHGDSENINPFTNITQMILNGKAFFEYTETYVEIYKRLFIQLNSSQLAEFKTFYKKHCLYKDYNWRKGDGYIREVYKCAIMATFDRFGEVGVNALYRALYICIYRHRLEKAQVRYETLAKNTRTSWIFQTLENAKTLSDLQLIEQKSLEIKNNLAIKYEVEAIAEVFKKK